MGGPDCTRGPNLKIKKLGASRTKLLIDLRKKVIYRHTTLFYLVRHVETFFLSSLALNKYLFFDVKCRKRKFLLDFMVNFKNLFNFYTKFEVIRKKTRHIGCWALVYSVAFLMFTWILIFFLVRLHFYYCVLVLNPLTYLPVYIRSPVAWHFPTSPYISVQVSG